MQDPNLFTVTFAYLRRVKQIICCLHNKFAYSGSWRSLPNLVEIEIAIMVGEMILKKCRVWRKYTNAAVGE